MDTLVVLLALAVGVIIAAAICLSLLLGMLIVWPLSLILILLGGFIFGGAGALVGGAVSGVVGICLWDRN